ncbi:MAG: hypothetical protein JSS07_05185 [Proteobacteria bacterium]|nr:hypothetical protein [Pseudomonadota bacterium]
MDKLNFDISTEQDNINFPHKEQSTSYVDEEGLLPGAQEARETTGTLTHSSDIVEIQFDPIKTQLALSQLELTSKGVPLHYELAHNNHLLIASTGATDIAVFTAYLDTKGTYSFTLHNHLDRAAAPNLVNNTVSEDNIPWAKTNTSIFQEIDTQPHEPYSITFRYQPIINPESALKETQLFWGGKLLYTFSPSEHAGKGFTFSVEGMPNQDTTKLQFVSEGIDNQFNHIVQNISVTSAAQHKLPISLCYNVLDNEGHVSHDQFTVNVTTTPPIELHNTEPFDVIYDEGVYQTIIVQANSLNQDTPLNTINIDNLFKNLAIAAENRLVEVVQRVENGHGTNVYEVQISDKSQSIAPITIADVQLSFPGGDGGLTVFHRNVIIEEGDGLQISQEQQLV